MFKSEFKNNKLGAFIVPTGIGASIGGYAGDASAWARKFAEFSHLIVNPNVVNAGYFSGITENMLYVEGYILDEFFRGNVCLSPSKNNKIGVVFDKGISEKVLNIHINTINAVKTVYGTDIIHEITQEPVEVSFFLDESGISMGKVKNIETLVVTAKNLIKKGADAIAVVCKFKDDNENEEYENGIGVDPIGGVEAIISHYLSKELKVPVAHAPAFEDFSISTKIVNPKSSAEYITPTFLPCILIGLSQAPLIEDAKKNEEETKVEKLKGRKVEGFNLKTVQLFDHSTIQPEANPLFTASPFGIQDLEFMIMPYNALGSTPIFEAVKRGIKVFAIKENESVLNVTKESLLLKNIIEVDSYEECLNIITSC